MSLSGRVARQWLVFGMCVTLGFAAGILRRQFDPSLQNPREQEIRSRLAGPAIYLSDAESQQLTQELRVIDKRTFASDLVSGLRVAVLVALVWCLTRVQAKWGIVLAVTLFALVGAPLAELEANDKEGLSLVLRLFVDGCFGGGISTVVWIAAEEVEPHRK